MKWFNYIIARLFDGVLYGIGITMCLVLGIWAMQAFYIHRALSRISHSQNADIIHSSTLQEGFSMPTLPEGFPSEGYRSFSGMKEFDETAMLHIVEHHDRVNGDGTIDFLGRLKNEGADTWRSIEIEVELFDEAGQFQGEYNTYVNRLLKPGETENIQVSSSLCGNRQVPEYATYTIRVINAMDY